MTTPRPAALQTLEPRVLLDGDVNVQRHAGVLLVRGDREDNAIAVTPQAGTVTITGQNDTRVNGSTNSTTFTAPGNGFDRVLVQLGRGDDRLTLSGIDRARALTVAADPEDDALGVTDVTTPVLSARLGNGDNTVRVADSSLGVLAIRTTGEGDVIALHDNMVTRNSLLDTGGGDDRIRLNQVGI